MGHGGGMPGVASSVRALPDRARGLPRYVGALVLVGGTYYVAARLSLQLALIERNVTPLWPPTGISVVAFLLLGRKTWPGVAAAAFAVNLPISANVLSAAVTAAGNTLAPLVAAALLDRVGFRRQIDRLRDAMSIVFLGALASMLISASIGAATLAISGAIPRSDLLAAWAVWWAGDAMGVLVVTPFLLSLRGLGQAPTGRLRDRVEAGLLLVVVAAVSWEVSHADLRLLFLVIPFVGLAAWRFQQQGAAPAALLAVGAASLAAGSTVGPFATGTLLERMLTLQAFNATVAFSSLFFAAVVTERLRAREALELAASELEERVRVRTAELRQREGQLQEAQGLAETLQRSLLPDRLPEIPGVLLAARYVPATADVEIGGDWYDVMQLPDGSLGLAIGDVAGHGVRAASTMGQVRMAVRAYALEEGSPARVLGRAHRLVQRLGIGEMVTLIYLVFDPDSGEVRFSNAGHPPPLVVSGDGAAFLTGGLAPPLGAEAHADRYTDARSILDPGSTLLLYTDGLVERRGVSLDDGLDRLRSEAAAETAGVDELCDLLLDRMVRDEAGDDIALLAVRPVEMGHAPLRLHLAAEPQSLGPLRQTLRRWLRSAGAGDEDVHRVVTAVGEAATNVIQHAYGAREGSLEVEVAIVDGAVEATVRDTGSWRTSESEEGGRGLRLIEGTMDTTDLESGPDGTMLRMRRRLRGPDGKKLSP